MNPTNRWKSIPPSTLTCRRRRPRRFRPMPHRGRRARWCRWTATELSVRWWVALTMCPPTIIGQPPPRASPDRRGRYSSIWRRWNRATHPIRAWPTVRSTSMAGVRATAAGAIRARSISAPPSPIPSIPWPRSWGSRWAFLPSPTWPGGLASRRPSIHIPPWFWARPMCAWSTWRAPLRRLRARAWLSRHMGLPRWRLPTEGCCTSIRTTPAECWLRHGWQRAWPTLCKPPSAPAPGRQRRSVAPWRARPAPPAATRMVGSWAFPAASRPASGWGATMRVRSGCCKVAARRPAPLLITWRLP